MIARDLVLATDDRLADSAAVTGFSLQSHLTTAFRNGVGTTQGLLRRDSPAYPTAYQSPGGNEDAH